MPVSLCDGIAVVEFCPDFDADGNCLDWPVQFRWVGPDFRFQRIENGHVTDVRLVRVGGSPAPQVVPIQPMGDRLAIDLGIAGVNVWIEMSEFGPRLMRQLGGPGAPKTWVWETVVDDIAAPLQLLSRGRDNIFGYADRDDSASRLLEVTSTASSRVECGKRVSQVTETWTGRVVKRDAHTRIPKLSEDVQWPVYFDPTWGPTAIQDTANDGREQSGTWSFNISAIYVGTVSGGSNGGWRWTGVTVPQGATINSATLGLYVNNDYNTTSSGKFYGEDADDAAQLANSTGNKPSERTKTTATVTFTPAGTGAKTLDVTSIVQEIVDRAGWASGNAMQFFGMNNADSWMIIQDAYNNNNANRATLTIDYTEASSPPTITSVTLTGTSQIGQTLTATVVTDQDPVDLTEYQWHKASDDTGTGSATIAGATSDDLVLTYSDFADLLDSDPDSVYVNCTCTATKNSLESDPDSSDWQQVTIPSGGGAAGSLIGSPLII